MNTKLMRINNDVNGNPRYVCHFLELLSESDKDSCRGNDMGDVSRMYALALKKSRAIGGRKYHNKRYGGGIAFQSYNTSVLESQIENLKNNAI